MVVTAVVVSGGVMCYASCRVIRCGLVVGG